MNASFCVQLKNPSNKFDYSLDYKSLNLRRTPDLYKVGIGEQGVLLVEPYKSEILPHWRFRTPKEALQSAKEISKIFYSYKKKKDFVGMDMARKFLQMGFTRSRRYANHSTGKKYDSNLKILPFKNDSEKAKSAKIFKLAWENVEQDQDYSDWKLHWKLALG